MAFASLILCHQAKAACLRGQLNSNVRPHKMQPWNVEETRNAIAGRFGRDQLELARPCLRSLSDRQFYTRLHYQSAQDILKRYVKRNLRDKELIEVTLGGDAEDWQRFNIVVRKIGAHITAGIQSMHAIPDILASAIYYSCALDRTAAPPKGRYVNHDFVKTVLQDHQKLSEVLMLFSSVTDGEMFRHLAALSNQSKHYSIVFPSINADMTGTRAEPHAIALPGFMKGKKYYPQVLASDFLGTEYGRMSALIVNCGHALNSYLRASVA